MEKRTVKITIDNKGQFSLEAQGISGESCVEKTRALELALGGEVIGEGKTSDYYDDGDSPVSVNLNI